jgi:hypothetical protein
MRAEFPYQVTGREELPDSFAAPPPAAETVFVPPQDDYAYGAPAFVVNNVVCGVEASVAVLASRIDPLRSIDS